MTYDFSFEALKLLLVTIAEKTLYAIVVYVVGKYLITKIEKLLSHNKVLTTVNLTAKTFISSFIKVVLYVMLFITIIGILGVPMASLVAVVASCAAAVGLALQGSLSNFAGGIMILIFKPFKVNDFIETSSVKGTVKAINIFYTIINTPDNKRINIPNGTLMNSVVTNYTDEPYRRVDIPVKTSRDEDVCKVLDLLNDAVSNLKYEDRKSEKFIGYEGMDEESYNFIVKVWSKTDDYWNLYYETQKEIYDRFTESNVKGPYKRVSNT